MAEEMDWKALLDAEFGDIKPGEASGVWRDESPQYDDSANTQYLASQGFDAAGRDAAEARAMVQAKRLENKARTESTQWSIKMAEDGHAIRAMAQVVDGLKDVFAKMVPAINEAAEKSVHLLADEAVRNIESTRRRSPVVMRPQYDRRPPGLLENAVKEAATLVDVGNGAILAGFDEDILDRGTEVDSKSGHGYWRAYEFGKRFVMPEGVWRGPDGRYVKSERGRNDAFYVSRGTNQTGRRGYWAKDPAMHALGDAMRSMEEIVRQEVASTLPHVFQEYLEEAAAGKGGPGYDTGASGIGSVAHLGEV